jgi:large subunit ribosomal protein L9
VRVRVLFLQDVPPRYLAGEIREVASGYARNLLIPQGLAAPATKDHLNRIATVKKLAEEKRKAVSLEMSQLAERLKGASVTLRVRSGEGGRLYGSITNIAIAEEIKKELGLEVDRRLIDLPEPIRTIGTFPVAVKLSAEHTPTVTVNVESSLPVPAAATEAQPAAETSAS